MKPIESVGNIMAKPESVLVERISNHLICKHNNIPFRFDQIDQLGVVNGKRNKMLHGKWNTGYPDLFIATCRKGFGGLYLELKATKDGKVPDTEHTRRQAEYHAVLRYNGYKVSFCVGFDDCCRKIKKYLKIK